MTRILILGGTKEAAELAAKLCSEGHDVETSLAGRTKEPEPLIGNVRIGGFGGSAGLAEYLKANKIDLLIDATHPFAKQISKNAREAALLANVNFQSQTRAPWLQVEGDVWKEVSSLDEAKKAIPEKARVLLALGSQHIDQLSILENIF
ncbi:MAG: precorrin-6A/cobalt-precorrin-6A reductase, partial [Pseudomonadota bacterium]